MIDTSIKVILLLLMAGGAVALVLTCTMMIIDLIKKSEAKIDLQKTDYTKATSNGARTPHTARHHVCAETTPMLSHAS